MKGYRHALGVCCHRVTGTSNGVPFRQASKTSDDIRVGPNDGGAEGTPYWTGGQKAGGRMTRYKPSKPAHNSPPIPTATLF